MFLKSSFTFHQVCRWGRDKRERVNGGMEYSFETSFTLNYK